MSITRAGLLDGPVMIAMAANLTRFNYTEAQNA